MRNSHQRFQVKVDKDYPWQCLLHLAADLCSQMDDKEGLSVIHATVRSRDSAKLASLAKEWSLQCIDDSLIGECRYLLGSLIKKYPLSNDRVSLRNEAIKKLDEAEAHCSLFNRKGYKRLFTEGVASTFLLDSKEFIEKVIGYLPDLDWTESRHGPGADTDSHGKTSLYDKYSAWPYHVTSEALGLARSLILSDARWLGALENSYRERYNIEKYCILDWDLFWQRIFIVKQYNKVTTVPKDGQTDRPIAIEPRMNLMLQLGVDGFIRTKLKRWGIDLDSQLKNMDLAKQGSLRFDADSPVTLDLSNASDTISLRIVKLLFPRPWYRLLVALRSPKGIFPDGRRLRYSKLSSMGNGATFAVESLVYAAVCYAASKYTYGYWNRDNISIFGDDIIVPQAMCGLTTTLLKAYGFILNEHKCFVSGNRRESCGADWIAGRNVRPVFLKEKPATVRHLYCDLNRIHRWATQRGLETPTFNSYLLRFIPVRYRLYGPLSDEEFDSWIHSPVSNRSYGKSKDHLYSFRFNAISERSVSRRGRTDFLFRKLMAQLRVFSSNSSQFQTKSSSSINLHLKIGGSVFDVLDRRTTLRLGKRVCHYWQNEYLRA